MCRRSRLSCVAALGLAAACAALAAATTAAAAPGIRYGLKDDAWLLHGPGTVAGRVASLQSLGVQIVRFSLPWNEIAATRPAHASDPADPAYDWSGSDPVIDALRSAGIDVILDIVGAPAWSNGGQPPAYAPKSASSMGAFARAAGTRYRWVRRWAIWNEPNQRRWLMPTSPVVYVAKLLNPAYAALHAVVPRVSVAGGVTAPRSSTNGVSPVAWIRGMSAAGAHLDAYAHNPYPLNPRTESPTSGSCSYCLTLTMATLPKLLATVKAAFGPKRVWLTEYGYQTNPPDRLLGVSPTLQARYLGDAALRTYLAPRVDVLIHFLYRDEPTLGRFQSGLVWLNDRPKPAYSAFELPLAQRSRSGTRVSLWGQLRVPEAGAVRLQVHRGGWRTVAPAPRPAARGVFTWTGALPAGTIVRAVAGSVTGAAIVLR